MLALPFPIRSVKNLLERETPQVSNMSPAQALTAKEARVASLHQVGWGVGSGLVEMASPTESISAVMEILEGIYTNNRPKNLDSSRVSY